MNLKKVIMMLGFAALTTASASAAESLVKNPEFNFKGTRMPHWRSTSKSIVSDPADLPEGCKSSVKVTIDGQQTYDGYIRQKIDLPEKDMDMKMSVMVKGSVANVGYLQIKLMNGKKELKRISVKGVKTEWKEISKNFITEDADSILLLCRFRQTADYQGQSIWFANPKVTAVTE